MALTPLRWPSAGQVLDLAERLRDQSEDAGLPPGIGRLDSRPRAAFDRLVDALNRLPRPAAALGMLGLLGAALVAPDWFSDRMEALARMPEGLWWLIGAVLSLHFGARVQAHAQDFRREILATAAPAPRPTATTPAMAAPSPDATLTLDTLAPAANPALSDWRARQA